MSRLVCIYLVVFFALVSWMARAYSRSASRLSFRGRTQQNTAITRTRTTNLSMAKRKTRVKRVAEKRDPNPQPNPPTSKPISDFSVPSSSSSSPFDINSSSQLAPLKSTAREKQLEYQEKPAIQRQVEDLLAPTPAGQDPKLAVLAKQVTWIAVIGLVLIEIFVSLKTGGMPFSKEAVRI